MPYTVYPTQFGPGWIAFADGEPLSLGLPASDPPGGAVDPQPPATVAALASDLERYFAGRGPLPSADRFIPSAATTGLSERIYRCVAAIDAGDTMTYGEVAAAVGAPRAARAVGAAMARNSFAPVIPCHRVVGSDGSLRGYAGGLAMKRALLAMEAEHD